MASRVGILDDDQYACVPTDYLVSGIRGLIWEIIVLT